jgi:hypothetical protein
MGKSALRISLPLIISGRTVVDGFRPCESPTLGMGLSWFPGGSHPKEGTPTDSNAVLQNPTHAQWPRFDCQR